MRTDFKRLSSFAVVIVQIPIAMAAAQDKPGTAALLEKIFVSGEFDGKAGIDQIQWVDGGEAYLRTSSSTSTTTCTSTSM